MKKCNRCKEEKGFIFFHKDKTSKDGFAYICKECEHKRRKQFYQENKEYELKRNNKWRLANSEKVRQTKKKWYNKNKEICLKKSKIWKENNPEYMKNYSNRWRKTNKDRKTKLDTLYRQKRYKNDPAYKIRKIVSSRVREALLKQSASKNNSSTWKHLPYTPQQLKEHLEKQFDENMTWENYGSYWHIDHIYPQSLLPYDSLDHPNFLKCWSLSNLQPLEAKENTIKSNRI